MICEIPPVTKVVLSCCTRVPIKVIPLYIENKSIKDYTKVPFDKNYMLYASGSKRNLSIISAIGPPNHISRQFHSSYPKDSIGLSTTLRDFNATPLFEARNVTNSIASPAARGASSSAYCQTQLNRRTCCSF